MLARRVIPCLDVADGVVVKGVRFRDHRVVGDIIELARRYAMEGADELVFYDIAASPEGRSVDRAWIERVARELDIPFCVAGGVRSIADAEALLAAGADKVSVNSPALRRPSLVDELAARFGTQCVVVGIDVDGSADASTTAWRVILNGGKPESVCDSGRTLLDWVREVADRGAGEIVLNSMCSDGVRAGYAHAQLTAVRASTTLPLVASGGAGAPQHFADVFERTSVDAALAASVFHSGEIRIDALKEFLAERGIVVRR
jgi:cyclase